MEAYIISIKAHIRLVDVGLQRVFVCKLEKHNIVDSNIELGHRFHGPVNSFTQQLKLSETKNADNYLALSL